MKKVSLVILHFKDKKLTNQCLESVKKLHCPKGFDLQTIVVNNNPQGDLRSLRVKFKEFNFIKTGENLGFAGGNNFGIKYALKGKPDYVLILNNDVFVDKNLVVELVKVAEREEKIGLVGAKIYFAPGHEFHKERYKKRELGKVIWYAGGRIDWNNVFAIHRGLNKVDKGQYERAGPTGFVNGCCMLITKQTLERVGLFDERYFLYLEEVEFNERVRRFGHKLFFAPKAKLWHKIAGSSRIGSPLQDYYIARNRMLFGMRYASLRTKFALIRESMRLLLIGRKWQKIGIRDFYLSKFGKGSYKEN